MKFNIAFFKTILYPKMPNKKLTIKKSLKDLSDEDCGLISSEMIKNSDRRWDSAKILADNEDYGGAIRDHITSMEEMIKGLLMFLDSKGFEFRKIEEMEGIIRKNHTIRHFIGFIMFVINIFASEFENLILKCKEEPSSMLKIFNEQKEKKDLIIKMYFFRKILLIKEEFLWFSKVEIYRQEGIHVDYNPSIGSPLDINIDDYKEVYKRLENVRNVGCSIIEILTADVPKPVIIIHISFISF